VFFFHSPQQKWGAFSPMAEALPQPELLRSLGRLVRGLAALFWALPITLLVCFHTARTQPLGSYGVLPPLLTTGWILYGLWLIGDFQKQERVWRRALHRARLLALVNVGLSPFLYWWSRVPANPFFLAMVVILVFSGVLFLGSLNTVVQRLGAMLPDETLRLETQQFTRINQVLLLITFILGLLAIGLRQLQAETMPLWLYSIQLILNRGSLFLLVPLVLLPLAMTMALLWKTKEVILESVFSDNRYS
jgi:hypothetical protein